MLDKMISQYYMKIEEQKQLQERIEFEAEKIKKKITMRKKQVERLEKKKDKVMCNYYKFPSWVELIVEPLMEQLEKATGLKGEIYGPFGLNSRTSIYLTKNPELSITEQTSLKVTIEPPHGTHVKYETGKTKSKYQRGSIGKLNGRNKVLADLPNRLEEIIEILHGDKTLLD